MTNVLTWCIEHECPTAQCECASPLPDFWRAHEDDDGIFRASVVEVRAALRASTPDPRPAGCVCPVERVRREVRACPVHGGDHA